MFKVGDKVRRKAEDQNGPWYRGGEVLTVRSCEGTVVHFVGVADSGWDPWRFELVEEPAKPAVPGIPDGYRLVRIGTPDAGEYVLDSTGGTHKITSECFAKNYVIVEPAKPLAPKMKKVKLKQYVFKSGANYTSTPYRDTEPKVGWYVEVPGSKIEVEVPDEG